ncbi:MAG: hypothetical protein K1X49_12185 [Saprospiraceae bacterium]|jgi:hypothetical protein|nr:hypothetical protein [Saprospiraceae bacterium]
MASFIAATMLCFHPQIGDQVFANITSHFYPVRMGKSRMIFLFQGILHPVAFIVLPFSYHSYKELNTFVG